MQKPAGEVFPGMEITQSLANFCSPNHCSRGSYKLPPTKAIGSLTLTLQEEDIVLLGML